MSTDIAEFSCLEQIVMLNPDIHIFSGVQALSEDDLGARTVEELPRDVISWGSKRVVDSEALAPFYRIKKGVERTALQFGSKFLGGYAIPEPSIDTCVRELKALRDEFADKKQFFMTNYADLVSDWARKHPEWADRIRATAPSSASVSRRIDFTIRAWRIKPSGIDLGDSGLLAALNNLPSTVLKEAIADLVKAYEAGKPRGYCSHRAYKYAYKAYKKLDCMRLVDPWLTQAARLLHDLYDFLYSDKTEVIDGIKFAVIGRVIDEVIKASGDKSAISVQISDIERSLISEINAENSQPLLEDGEDDGDGLALTPELPPEGLVVPAVHSSWAF